MSYKSLKQIDEVIADLEMLYGTLKGKDEICCQIIDNAIKKLDFAYCAAEEVIHHYENKIEALEEDLDYYMNADDCYEELEVELY